ncbi:hypothetical protein DWX43_04765 [Clostridium sp. AF19-22AC]|jgi:hypothetical protein|uniref:hypothetical protein n=1 Tax=Clostridia TaxID=186801 RepID=UPI000E4A4D9D|nr:MULTISPECIES: hypothetical protein [Clostridia]RHR31964.1 hypothetical protein DWX43_04765 [Clostridium sp. AF19-22AC]
MKSWISSEEQKTVKDRLPEQLRSMDAELPEAVIRWLAGLHLLYGVPFAYLVPDERMLPLESIRFFHLDLVWIQALIDGAMSVGRNTGREQDIDKLCGINRQKGMKASLRYPRMSRMNRRHWREEEIRQGFQSKDEVNVYTGFLLRSELVRFWNGIEVSGVCGGNELPCLRMERLGDNVLLGIYEGKIDEVIFTEPAEELHFGTREENHLIQVRSITKGEIGKPTGDTVEMKADKNGRVDIMALADSLEKSLGLGNGELNAAHAAFEMISAADICHFRAV